MDIGGDILTRRAEKAVAAVEAIGGMLRNSKDVCTSSFVRKRIEQLTDQEKILKEEGL